ncbi:sulfite exporter TauE/SafE family protein [Levilactobacillus acidifarinae]|uniref:Probable membrane transporter protein n=1 Tax=Levilactobacillus acidifarinae DSM 19394 = JCM 15949 TaxID=1423715 RepID=A0A0R1LKP7_9LACO|nr:sulfite exporter TauE/SafE family protein [Levilactobacillus acidifarinae]KRK96429.1 anion exporter, taue safe family [Levilactobacillus acidifarinae DSM 19394]GEO68985.1 TauE [Levilactobacillus acidifarinae]
MLVLVYGVLIGAFISVMGGGGAALYLGVLTSQIGISTAVAAPTSLIVAIPALLFGCVTQIRIHNVHFDLGNRMILAALPGIFLGTGISPFIPAKIYDWVVGTILMVMGAIVVIRGLRQGQKVPTGRSRLGVAVGLGFLSGMMVGIGGLTGGGPTVAGLSILGLSAMSAAGTSTYVLSVMALVGAVSHLFTGNIAWSAGVTLMIGSVIGAVVTPLLLHRLNMVKLNKWLTPLMGLVIVYFGVNIFFK